MSKVCLTPFEYASRDIGVREVRGHVHNPYILAMLRLDNSWPESDEVPWCSAWLNWKMHALRLPRSKSLVARSWLDVGVPVDLSDCQADADVVVLSRAGATMDSNDRTSPGHVGLFAGWAPGDGQVLVLAGNQGNAVSIAAFSAERVIGARRLN